MASLLQSLIQVHGKSPVSTLTEEMDDERDVILADTNRFEISKDLKQSTVNIYNPRNVTIGGMGAEDPTTAAERREEELERRRRRSSLLGGSGVGLAGAGVAGAAGAGAGTADEEGGPGGGILSSLLNLIKNNPLTSAAAGVLGLRALRGSGARGAGGSPRPRSFRLSGLATPRQAAIMRRLNPANVFRGRAPAVATAAERTSLQAGERLRRGFTMREMGRSGTRFVDSAGNLVKKADAVRSASRASQTVKILRGAGGTALRGASMLKNLAGGPIGIALIGAEIAAGIYIDRLNESNAANAIKNAAYPRRRGNTYSTIDGTEIYTIPDETPRAERAILIERANLIQNGLTILGLSKEVKSAFRDGRDTEGKIAADAITLLMSERESIAARMAGVMLEEGYISDISEGKRFVNLSPGRVGQGDVVIDYNDLGVGVDRMVRKNLDDARGFQNFTEFVDNASIEEARSSIGQVSDPSRFRETAERRATNFRNSRPSTPVPTGDGPRVVPEDQVDSAIANMRPGERMFSDANPANPTFGQTIIVSPPPSAAPSVSEDETIENLETRPSDTRELREQAGTGPIGSGPITASPI